jgi:predicted metal-dependent peptidase
MKGKTTESDIPTQASEVSEEEVKSFKLDPHLINLMIHEPFFSHVLRRFNKNRSDSVATAGIGVIDQNPTLFWNPRFLASLKSIQVRGLMKHECYHWIYKHCTSRKKDPHIIWNWATDLSINGLIREKELPDGGLVPGKPLDLSKITDKSQMEKWKKISDLVESLPKGMAGEWYFGKLQEDPDISEAIQSADQGEVIFDDHGEWGDLSEEDRQIVEGKIKQAISEAVRRCDSNGEWGSVPTGVREDLRKLVSNTISWTSILNNFCGRSQRLNKSRTMKRINRKYPYIHSGVRRGHSANIAIYMDQSGSVDSESIELLFAELNNLGKKINFTLFPFDTKVDEDNSVEWKRGQRLPPIRHRYGGTSFHAVASHAEKNANKFDGYIVLTDGECSDPGPSRLRRAWVIIPGRSLMFKPHSNDVVVNMERSR